MLPDNYGQEDVPEGQDRQRKSQPEFVGAPTEYADEAEVPEGIAMLAKAFAGGGLLVALLGLLGAGCAICAVVSFVLGLAAR